MTKSTKRLPPHFSVDPGTGDVFATDPASRRIFRFAREQVRLILALDETLRLARFDPAKDTIPGGYELFQHLWESDAGNRCGLAHLPDDAGTINIPSERIPSFLVLPRREDDEARDPQMYRRLVSVAAQAYLNERDRRAYHVTKRLHNKAQRNAVAAHHASTRLPYTRANSVVSEGPMTDFGFDQFFHDIGTSDSTTASAVPSDNGGPPSHPASVTTPTQTTPSTTTGPVVTQGGKAPSSTPSDSLGDTQHTTTAATAAASTSSDAPADPTATEVVNSSTGDRDVFMG
ncbi:hypothetical protein C8Q77DRAFT_1122830, partial [Trametes polyzona]